MTRSGVAALAFTSVFAAALGRELGLALDFTADVETGTTAGLVFLERFSLGIVTQLFKLWTTKQHRIDMRRAQNTCHDYGTPRVASAASKHVRKATAECRQRVYSINGDGRLSTASTFNKLLTPVG